MTEDATSGQQLVRTCRYTKPGPSGFHENRQETSWRGYPNPRGSGRIKRFVFWQRGPLFTGSLAGYLVRRREARTATTPAPRTPTSPEPTTSAAPTIVRPAQPSAMPRIVRLKEDSTTVLAAPPTEEISAATTALRIQRREPVPGTTTRVPTPPHDDVTKPR